MSSRSLAAARARRAGENAPPDRVIVQELLLEARPHLQIKIFNNPAMLEHLDLEVDNNKTLNNNLKISWVLINLASLMLLV
jgi:hypothetical protein